MNKAQVGKLLALVVGVGLAFKAQAQIDGPEVVYRNGSDPILGFYAPADNAVEYGDEIAFDGTNRLLTSIKLEYFSSEATGSMVVRIRQMDGDQVAGAGVATFKPGSIAYESPTIDLGANFNTLVIDQLPSNVLGSRVLVSVQLSGIAAGQQVGPLLRNPPIIGASADDIWISDGAGDWALASIPGATANFAVEIVAVPEPATVLLSVLGGAALFGFRRMKRA
mmetsp:Transcript_1274/g.1716  ORF Transcript_1274/g.1716 Transcript_1274/m.1716 type:complete len:223 (-) Transcript_1274:13-681(-)